MLDCQNVQFYSNRRLTYYNETVTMSNLFIECFIKKYYRKCTLLLQRSTIKVFFFFHRLKFFVHLSPSKGKINGARQSCHGSHQLTGSIYILTHWCKRSALLMCFDQLIDVNCTFQYIIPRYTYHTKTIVKIFMKIHTAMAKAIYQHIKYFKL